VATGAYLPQIRRILQFAIVVATMIVIRHQAPFSFERKGDLPSTSRQTITGSKTTDDNGYSTRIMEATFPLVMVPKSEKKGPDGHFDLMENRDGRYNESKCETWIASGPRHSFACDIEWDEWMLANAFIQPGDVVVEFGARFGTTSCILSRNVGKHGEVISVEPDVTVHGHLLRNRQSHGCDFHAVLGTVSSEPIYMGSCCSYAQRTSETGEGPALPSISTDEIETILGRKINVALIDCEGCITQIDKTSLLDESKGVDLILMEEDQIKYGEWHKILYQRNYHCIWYLEDTYYHKHENAKRWSLPMRHSVWLHKRALDSRVLPGSCKEYIDEQGFASGQIVCAECPSNPGDSPL